MAEKAKGLATKVRNKELLEHVYGRVLGEIFIQDSESKQYNINETLVVEGHAYEYFGGKKQLFKG